MQSQRPESVFKLIINLTAVEKVPFDADFIKALFTIDGELDDKIIISWVYLRTALCSIFDGFHEVTGPVYLDSHEAISTLLDASVPLTDDHKHLDVERLTDDQLRALHKVILELEIINGVIRDETTEMELDIIEGQVYYSISKFMADINISGVCQNVE
ncbi:hypothetical protein GJ496_006365 [Pomphorhynchus laevis]|nr:hypothetical protein GJ496_006365 [Pomphorhynchus laevis]